MEKASDLILRNLEGGASIPSPTGDIEIGPGTPDSDKTIVPSPRRRAAASLRIGAAEPSSAGQRRDGEIARGEEGAIHARSVLSAEFGSRFPPPGGQTSRPFSPDPPPSFSSGSPLSSVPPTPMSTEEQEASAPSYPTRESGPSIKLSPNSAHFLDHCKGGAMDNPRPSPSSRRASGGPAPYNLQSKLAEQSNLIKQQGDDIARLERKLDNLSTWTDEQFTDLVTRVSNLSQSNSDTFARQTQLSFAMSKSRFEMSTAITRELNRLHTEINGLVASLTDVNSKVDICLQRILGKKAENFVDYQCRQNERLDNEIAGLTQEINNLKLLVIRIRIGLTVTQPNHPLSYEIVNETQGRPPSPGVVEPVSTSPPSPRVVDVETVSASPPASPSSDKGNIRPVIHTISRQKSTPQFSTTPSPIQTDGMPRSVSGNANAFNIAKVTKVEQSAVADSDKLDLTEGMPRDSFASDTPQASKETIDKGYKRTETDKDNDKRWGIFGRRRRQASDGSNSGKFPWSGRRQKESNTASIPPVPAIPESVLVQENPMTSSPTQDFRLSMIHPALRPGAEGSSGTASLPKVMPKGLSPTAAVDKNTAVEEDEEDYIISPPFSLPPSPIETRDLATWTPGSRRSSKEGVSPQ